MSVNDLTIFITVIIVIYGLCQCAKIIKEAQKLRVEAAQLIEKIEIVNLGWICCSCVSTRTGEYDYCEKCKDVSWAKPVNYKHPRGESK